MIRALAGTEQTRWEDASGTIRAQHFTAPGLKGRYRDDLLYFYVPPAYETSRPIGLLIFMHGGGSGTPREYAGVVVAGPEEEGSYHLRPHIDHAPFITVAPSAPWSATSDDRWGLPEADAYLAAVMCECRYRFNVDVDRVFLGGWSMGGFGAYHLCHRLSDRIAGGLLGAGCWYATDWRCVLGTPLFIIHGAQDAVAPGTPGRAARPRFTDVFFARAADRLLTEAGVPHVYAEYEGGHSPRDAARPIADFVAWTRSRVRDPFCRRVVALTPRGMDVRSAQPAPHCRWVSILATGAGHITVDTVNRVGPAPAWGEDLDSFRRQGFEVARVRVPAGRVEAQYTGGNAFRVRTENVTRLSIWLHPRMVSFRQPIVVVVNGRRRLYRARASLLDALRSYERREDWGLVYHSEIVVEVPEPRVEQGAAALGQGRSTRAASPYQRWPGIRLPGVR